MSVNICEIKVNSTCFYTFHFNGNKNHVRADFKKGKILNYQNSSRTKESNQHFLDVVTGFKNSTGGEFFNVYLADSVYHIIPQSLHLLHKYSNVNENIMLLFQVVS